MQVIINKLINGHFVRRAVKIVFLSPLIATICLADSPKLPERFGIGREPTVSEIGQWDIDIMPDGRQLPMGQGTVDAGSQIYLQKCLGCHGPEGRNGINDQLVGEYSPDNEFATDRTLKRTIGNYWPYATTLYDYINRAMPMTTPGSLNADEVYGLVAYLLYLNGIVDKDITLDATSLRLVEMPANRLFYWSKEATELAENKNKQ